MSDAAFEKWIEEAYPNESIKADQRAHAAWQAAMQSKLLCGHPGACLKSIDGEITRKRGDSTGEFVHLGDICAWCADKAELEAERDTLRAALRNLMIAVTPELTGTPKNIPKSHWSKAWDKAESALGGKA